MIRYLLARDLGDHPSLADAMFRDRAAQFRDRLGWPVAVDAEGRERDGYDAASPLYVVATDADGRHAGSVRLLPTTGPTMLNDVFGHLVGRPVRDPLAWEATRFCLAPGAASGVARVLIGATIDALPRFGLEALVGVIDARVLALYRRAGVQPAVMGYELGEFGPIYAVRFAL